MDTAQWPQEVGIVKPMEEMASNTSTKPMLERSRVRPQKDQAINCPRCSSTNTKFCYYNNYSLTQPRYFCKTCRRYWTEGGSLRNIPVGGGSRKNRRSTTNTSSSASSHKLPDLNPPTLSQFSSQNPKSTHGGQDLKLGFPATQDQYHGVSEFVKLPKIETNSNNTNHQYNSSFSSPTLLPLSALELLRTGIASGGLNCFAPAPMPDSNPLYTPVFPLQEFKPTLSFSVDHHDLGSRYGSLQGVQESAGRLMFPFGALKDLSRASEVDQNKGHGNSTGCWNGMLGGGSW
ncbi:hypothetical protein F0562_019377 [Nyssa sinensis]|uniref:Dof zinc finger protein n=1 Tax=Nyssa sinensis TaxID=561372 RepID=A0A5J4ZF96_9ASTE|nr:hypothetical protein F0562_019377 [Nyssa sinensis]